MVKSKTFREDTTRYDTSIDKGTLRAEIPTLIVEEIAHDGIEVGRVEISNLKGGVRKFPLLEIRTEKKTDKRTWRSYHYIPTEAIVKYLKHIKAI